MDPEWTHLEPPWSHGLSMETPWTTTDRHELSIDCPSATLHHHGMSMEPSWTDNTCPRNHYGLSMEARWVVYGLFVDSSIDSPWNHHGLPMYYPWNCPWTFNGTVHGTTMDYPWTVYGPLCTTMDCTRTPWTVHGPTVDHDILSMEPPWTMEAP